MKEINDYAGIAYNILVNTNYSRDKKIISDIFKTDRNDRFETIIFRLTIIDCYYSTQMNKRFFGLDDIASQLKDIDDESLKEKCKTFISDTSKANEVQNQIIQNLFNSTFGIKKTGHPFGHAASLIFKIFIFFN